MVGQVLLTLISLPQLEAQLLSDRIEIPVEARLALPHLHAVSKAQCTQVLQGAWKLPACRKGLRGSRALSLSLSVLLPVALVLPAPLCS